jgi:hypothetical protein
MAPLLATMGGMMKKAALMEASAPAKMIFR